MCRYHNLNLNLLDTMENLLYLILDSIWVFINAQNSYCKSTIYTSWVSSRKYICVLISKNSQTKEKDYYQNKYIVCSWITSTSYSIQLHSWDKNQSYACVCLSVCCRLEWWWWHGLGGRIVENFANYDLQLKINLQIKNKYT